ncbi:PIN domain-containing protein [Patulibacter sp. NPDC049589]|uniref:PIN domain-containing protein n=1 Tax=Patulibacter sp. NPDC049589 TaxID=3154731 RepID=UPI003433E55F
MSLLLDASALVAFVRGEPAAGEVADALRSGEAAVVSVNVAELTDVLVRRIGLPQGEVDAAADRLVALLEVRPVDVTLARRAGALRARRYHRDTAPLSLADCLCVAAVGSGDAVLSSDVPLLRAADAEGASVRVLPDSRGHRPRIT